MQHVSVEEEAKSPRIPPTNMVKTSENPGASLMRFGGPCHTYVGKLERRGPLGP